MIKLKNSPKLTSLAELVIFTSLVVGIKPLVDPFAWKFAGPISMVTTIIILAVYLHLKGRSLRSFGLPTLAGLRSKLLVIPQAALAFAGFAGVIFVLTTAAPALGLDFMDSVPQAVEDRFGDIRGNLNVYLLWMAIVWISAAFGEELFFRGFLITNFETLFGDMRGTQILAVILPAILFGALHYYYQGIRGALGAGGIGLVFGFLFLLFKRNLWPLILCHGVIDSIGMTARYLNLEGS